MSVSQRIEKIGMREACQRADDRVAERAVPREQIVREETDRSGVVFAVDFVEDDVVGVAELEPLA